jgi:hypothetical protein
MTKFLLKAYEKLFQSATSRLAATALTLSIIAIIIIWILFAGSLTFGGDTWKGHLHPF